MCSNGFAFIVLPLIIKAKDLSESLRLILPDSVLMERTKTAVSSHCIIAESFTPNVQNDFSMLKLYWESQNHRTTTHFICF
jgi:hypothetical protein